jgi:hypothetical protein
VALFLKRVEVIADGEAARHELELVLEHFAARFRRGTEKDEPVARGGFSSTSPARAMRRSLRRGIVRTCWVIPPSMM